MIGGEDGSVIVLGINDPGDPDALPFIAAQRSRRDLLPHLAIDPSTLPNLGPLPHLTLP